MKILIACEFSGIVREAFKKAFEKKIKESGLCEAEVFDDNCER